MTVEELQVIITAKTEGIRNEIGNVNKQLDGVNKQSEKAGAGIKKAFAASGKAIVAATKAIAVGVVAGGAALIGMAVKSAEAGDRVDKLSQKIGLSRKGFQEWDFICSQSGMSVEQLQGGFKKFSGVIDEASKGNKTAQDSFKQLGVSITDNSGKVKSQETLFNESVVALQGMEEGAEKSALANKILGKSASEMAPLINGAVGSVDEMKKKAHDLGLVLSDGAIDASVKFTDSMDQVKRSLSAVVTNVGVSVMPMLQGMLEWISNHMPQIQAIIKVVFDVISKVVKKAVDVFMTNLLPILKTVFDWVSTNMPQIKANITKAFDGLKPVFKTLEDAIKLVVDILIKVGTWMNDNKETVSNFAIVIGSFAAAWLLVTVVMGIWSIVAGIGAIATGALGGAVAFLTSPVTLVILAIGAVIAIGFLLWKNWDVIKAKAAQFGAAIKAKFAEMKASVVAKVTELKQGVVNKFNEIKSGITEKVAAIKTAAVGKFNEIKTSISTTVGNIKTSVVNKFNEIKGGAATAFNNVKTAVMTPINSLKTGVKGVVDSIKGFFSGLKITIPKIKMPHFNIKGSFSLSPPSVPSLGVNWYAQGGVFNKATTIGVGENGREAVMPLEKNTGWITELASKINGRMPQGQAQSGSDRPVEVILQIGSTQLGKVVIDSINKLQRQEGRILLNI